MNECLICKSKKLKRYKAKISNFILERLNIPKENEKTELCHCKNCGFAFYDYRYNDNEIKKIYSNYRDDFYQKQREKHDCWYTKEINDIIGKNNVEILTKKRNISELAKKHCDISKIKKILDYGGDMGQHIPDIFKNAEKYVYELSSPKVINNVTLIDNEKNLKTYDFIICQGVLEHISNIPLFIEKLKILLKNNGYLYVEVPLDSPFYKNPLSDLQFIFSKYYSLKNIVKHYINIKKSGYNYHLSEHLNYFNKNSLLKLFKQHNFNIMDININNSNHTWNNGKTICALVRKEEY